MKFLEYPGLVGWTDARPGIANSYRERSIRRGSRNGDLSFIGEFDGVANKVQYHLGDATLITVSSGKVRRDLGLTCETLFYRQWLQTDDRSLYPLLDRM